MTIYSKGRYWVLILRRTIATSFLTITEKIENEIYQFSVIKLNISTTFVLKSKLNLYCSESKNVYCFPLLLKDQADIFRICEKDIFEKKEKMKNGKRIFEDAMKKLWKEKKKNKKKSKKKKKKKKKCKKNCKKDEKKKKKKKD